VAFYVAAYDVEAIYPWWELGDQRYSAQLYRESVSYEGERLSECLAGIRAVAEVHLRAGAPATFFLVGRLVEQASQELRDLLDHPIFDLQSHSYTHADLVEIADDPVALHHELADSRQLIEDTFGRPVIGLTAPGGFTKGFAGQRNLLDGVWEAGYRYVRSAGLGPFDSVPAPITQPFWYTQDGFPDLLEFGLHAWHDNHLTGQPCVSHWPPVLPWGLPSKMAQTAQEVYQAYAPGIDHIAEHDLLTYIPCLHPWSIYRVDRQAKQIELLLSHAQKVVTIKSCTGVYEEISGNRSLADELGLSVC